MNEVHAFADLASCCCWYIYRYPDDPIDHYWFPINSGDVLSNVLVETLTANWIVFNDTFPPPAVMKTALTTNGTMVINIPYTHSYIWSMRLFFAELNPTTSATSRQFYAGLPDNDTRLINPFTTPHPHQTMEQDYNGTVPNFVFLFRNETISATSPGPLVNAMEIFELSQNQMAILTNEQDGKLSTQSQSSCCLLLPNHSSNKLASGLIFILPCNHPLSNGTLPTIGGT